MENNSPKQTYFDMRQLSDKHFFAPFFNQARHNAYNILNNIQEVMRMDQSPTDESELWYKSNIVETLIDGDPIGQQGIIELLDRWMPFVIINNRNNPNRVGERLKNYLWLLNNYRNYFSHHFHEPFDNFPMKPSQFHGFDGNENTSFTFDLNLKKEFLDFWNVSLDLLDKHFSTVFLHSDKSHLRQIRFTEDKETFTVNGVLKFVCNFLEIDDINKLLSRTKYYKATHNNKMRATREAFARLACKLPRPKVHSTDENQALLLDILNELAKAPKGVYDHLTEVKRAKLFIDIQDEFVSANDGTTDFRRIELRRKRDRFPYFALKFLEVSGRLPNLLFNLNLGTRLVKPIYEKSILGKKEKRRLTKEILTYGRLMDFRDGEKLYPDYVIDTEGVNRSGDSIIHLKFPLEQFRPKYHFSQERIGVKFKTSEELLVPDLIDNVPLVPDFFISLNDLPKLVMMCLTCSGLDVESYLRNKISSKKQFYDDVTLGKFVRLARFTPIEKGAEHSSEEANEMENRFNWLRQKLLDDYELTLTEVPEKIRDFLVRHKHKSLKEVIIYKMEQAQSAAVEYFEASKNDTLSRKKGELATLIARDIVKFYEPIIDLKNGKKRVKKLNSTQYKLLQSKLAYFGASKDELIHLCKEFDLFKRHPFLSLDLFKDVKIKGKFVGIGIKKFFRNYYEAKSNWLQKSILELNKQTPSDTNLYQVFYMFELYRKELDEDDCYKASFIAKYAEGIKGMPFYFTRNSYDKMLNIKPGDNFVKWMQCRTQGSKQWFYQIDNLEIESNPKTKHQRDKVIRHSLTKDNVLWEMAKAMSDAKMSEMMNKIDLSDYKEGQDALSANNILETVIPVRLGVAEHFITSMIKLKDYGSFRKYLKDRRLAGLLSYYPTGEDVSLDTIKTELNVYENNRFKVLKDCYLVEEKIYLSHKEAFIDKNYLKFRSQLALLSDESNQIWNKANRKLLSNMRNQYLHNKIPSDIEIGQFENGKVVELINAEIMRKFAEMLADLA